MDAEKELQKLKAKLSASQQEIKSLKGKLERSKNKIAKQKSELKKKEPESIELSEKQLRSLSNLLPGIDIRSLLSD